MDHQLFLWHDLPIALALVPTMELLNEFVHDGSSWGPKNSPAAPLSTGGLLLIPGLGQRRLHG